VEFLKHDADVLAAEPRPGAARRHRRAVPQHLASGRAVDAAEQVDDAALAGPPRAKEGDALARADREDHRPERPDGAVVEQAARAGERDHGGRRRIVRVAPAEQPLQRADHLRSDSITASMLPRLARRTPTKSSCALIITLWPSNSTSTAESAS